MKYLLAVHFPDVVENKVFEFKTQEERQEFIYKLDSSVEWAISETND